MTREAALRLIAVGLALATLAAYSDLRHSSFIAYDTPDYVLEREPVLRGLSADGVRWAFTNTAQANWHPLTWLSHMADVELFGVDPVAHKHVNLGLHILGSVVLLLVLHAMTGALGRSAFVAGVFALHPTHVESVAWVAERKDVLSALFWILAMGSYTGWVRHGGGLRYLATLLLFAAGLLAKPMLVTLPFALLLLDYWPLGRSLADWRRLLLEKLPFFALSAAISVVTYLAQQDEGALSESLALALRIATAPVAYVAYLGMAIYPADLAILYPHPGAPPLWQPIAATLLLAALSLGALSQARRRPYLLVGWLWYLGTLVPVIGLVQVGNQWIADRYTYLPFIGLSLALAWGLADLLGERRAARVAGGALAIAALGGCLLQTRVQLGYWTDTHALFSHALAVTERNWVAHSLVGVELFNRGEHERAIAELETAARIRPDHVRTRANLGAALLEHGRLLDAARHLDQARRLAPDDRDTAFALARLAELRGEEAIALDSYRRVLARHPDYAAAQRRLAMLLFARGERVDAESWLARSLEHEPGSAAGHAYLGRVLEGGPRDRESIRHYRRALELQPSQRLALRRLAWRLATHPEARRRDGREAVALAERLCERQASPEDLDVLAAAYAEAGRYDEAERTARRAANRLRAAPADELGPRIEAHRRLFEAGQPVRSEP